MTPKEKAIKNLVRNIKECNLAYRKGTALVSDAEYDVMLEDLKKLDPENPLLQKAVIEEVDKSDSRMEKLPLPMYSLEKIKEIKELKKFIQNVWGLGPYDKIIITPKYDGISLLVDELEGNAWTRGNGEEGQKSSSHFHSLVNGFTNSSTGFLYTFGEAIFPTKSWVSVKGEYKSPRNCVSGLFNSPDASPMLGNVRYVRYGTDRDDLDKKTQLDELRNFYPFTTTYYWVTAANFNNDDSVVEKFLSDIFEKWNEYKCDGLVIEVDKAEIRKKLGRLPNNNPRYAIAYKNPEWSERAETKVTGIEWNVSKDGKVKPVILLDPVDLCNATVQRASAYNAKYIVDNNICKDSVVVICRSGDVIPKHLKTLSYNTDLRYKMMDDMMICPSCGEPLRWDNSYTDLICLNSMCPQKRIAGLVYFFSVLGTDEFREPTIKKLYEAGYQTIDQIINITQKDLTSIEGIGTSLAKTLISQFQEYKKNGFPLARLMTAYNVFGGGLAEKTCQMIFDNLSEEDLKKVGDLETIEWEHLVAINGIGDITANTFNQGIKNYSKVGDCLPVSYIAQPKKKVAENQMNVCFTGFRNKEWEERLLQAGHKIASGVTSKTTHLVVKDINSGSSKKVKANSLQIPIYTEEEFEKFMKEEGI